MTINKIKILLQLQVYLQIVQEILDFKNLIQSEVRKFI